MGKCMETLLTYLKEEQFDILSFQEVSGGEISFDKSNTFQKIIDLGYDGEISVTWRYKDKPHSFFGSSVFFKPAFTLLNKKEIWLKDYMEIETLEGFKSEEFPKSALSVTLENEGKKFEIISTHLAWSPRATDTPEKLRQAEIFRTYMTERHLPFILSGDFNVTPDTKVSSMFDHFGRNLTKEHNLKNTLNLRVHRHKEELLREGGVAVDYIYVSPTISVTKFSPVDSVDLSDHLGLLLECEI
ncbi:MAG: hypothetical protein RLZZ455_86 [Candidatus Parcubacteria bacterium]|jgi:endonuclease/exonuclease/phosphatase family metal-dependent hydrolase